MEEKSKVLDVLRYQLNYVQQSGYATLPEGGPMPSPFLSTYSCPNFSDPIRSHACHECALWQFVPESARTEDVPCYHIDLGNGETIASLMAKGDRDVLLSALENWLRVTIAELELEELHSVR